MKDQADPDHSDDERGLDTGGTSPDDQQDDEVLLLEEIAEPPPKKPMMPPSRIAFLVFVVVAVVGIALESHARWGYTRTVKSLNQAFERDEEEGMGVYRTDLEQLVRGYPSRQYDEQADTETFTWKGIRTHRLEVQYTDLDLVKSYETP